MPTRNNAPRRSGLLDPAHADKRAARARAAREEVTAYLRAWKSERGCVDCGQRDWRCLDVDHMAGKTRPITQIRSVSLLQRELEAHKCVPRCANCHRIRTYEEQLGAPARARRTSNQL